MDVSKQVPGWWEGECENQPGHEAYPMDYYAKEGGGGGVWNSSYHRSTRKKDANVQCTSTKPMVSASRLL